MRGDFRDEARRFENIDRAALNAIKIESGVCPFCARDLRPVALREDVWGCSNCLETWHITGGINHGTR
jgi:ribosomal protein L37AE/L43A